MNTATYTPQKFFTQVEALLHNFKVQQSLFTAKTEEREQVYKVKVTGVFFPVSLFLDHRTNTFKATDDSRTIRGSFSYTAKELHFLYCNENDTWEFFALSFDYLRTNGINF